MKKKAPPSGEARRQHVALVVYSLALSSLDSVTSGPRISLLAWWHLQGERAVERECCSRNCGLGRWTGVTVGFSHGADASTPVSPAQKQS
ncbi:MULTISPECIES: hypothetical protein [unclassified Synechococcus]|uniref:hypothetical protein n=1 Tax=unclassified Synechococcus TaxID=2626047 RepID=UPI0012E8D84D|nr:MULTISPECIES: hypothetical protein [unclassified Synechococcus]